MQIFVRPIVSPNKVFANFRVYRKGPVFRIRIRDPQGSVIFSGSGSAILQKTDPDLDQSKYLLSLSLNKALWQFAV